MWKFVFPGEERRRDESGRRVERARAFPKGSGPRSRLRSEAKGVILLLMALLAHFRWCWFFPALGLGIAGGYFAGRGIAPDAVGGIENAAESARPAETDSAPPPLLGSLERISASGLEALPALWREMLAGGDNIPLRMALVDRWIELDPEDGFAFFTETEAEWEGTILNGVVPEYCGRWALVDPERALEAAKSITGFGPSAGFSIRAVAAALARDRPGDLFRLLAVPGQSRWLPASLSVAIRNLALTNPRAAVTAIENLDRDLRLGKGLAADLAGGWARQDPEAALAWARKLTDKLEDSDGFFATSVGFVGERTRALRAIARQLLERDPDAAAALYREAAGRSGDDQEGPFRHVVYDWTEAAKILSEADPLAALAWVARHFPEEAIRAIPACLPQNAVASLEALAALPGVRAPNGWPPEWPRNDWRPVRVEEALARVTEITNPVLRESFRAWLLEAQATTDPQAALAGAVRDLGDAKYRARILKEGMAYWARQDLAAASAWLATRPEGPERDATIAGLVRVASYSDPALALSWAGTISKESARVREIEDVYRCWQSLDGEAARTAVEALLLSDAEKTALRERGLDFLQ